MILGMNRKCEKCAFYVSKVFEEGKMFYCSWLFYLIPGRDIYWVMDEENMYCRFYLPKLGKEERER